jgi:hypothetical protein
MDRTNPLPIIILKKEGQKTGELNWSENKPGPGIQEQAT